MPSFDQDKITMSIESLNPQDCKMMLAHNTHNRAPKRTAISRYKRDMQAKRWEMNGEAIRFDINGVLLDGQNRLMACIEAGVPFTTLVIRGLRPESQATMDIGVTRDLADELAFRGYENTQSLKSVVLIHMQWYYGFYDHAMRTVQREKKPTNLEALDHLKDFPEMEECTRVARQIRKAVTLPVGAIGTMVQATLAVDVDDSNEFSKRLINYQTAGEGDPLNALYRRVGLMRDRRETVLPATAIYLLFRCWNAWRAGESMSRYLLGSPSAGWAPIPKLK